MDSTHLTWHIFSMSVLKAANFWSKHVVFKCFTGNPRDRVSCYKNYSGSGVGQCALVYLIQWQRFSNAQYCAALHSLCDDRFKSSICWLSDYSEENNDWLICGCNNHEGNSKKLPQEETWGATLSDMLLAFSSVVLAVTSGWFPNLHTHHIIDCTSDRVKATSCCHENNLLVSPQTANESDSQKESFGPLCRVSNECLKGIWPV